MTKYQSWGGLVEISNTLGRKFVLDDVIMTERHSVHYNASVLDIDANLFRDCTAPNAEERLIEKYRKILGLLLNQDTVSVRIQCANGMDMTFPDVYITRVELIRNSRSGFEKGDVLLELQMTVVRRS